MKLAAALSGIFGFLCFISLPFLPVTQTTAHIEWPQNNSINSVTSPLISYTPVRVDITIPYATIDAMGTTTGTVLSTVPAGSVDPSQRGLFVRATSDTIDVMVRDVVVTTIPRAEIRKIVQNEGGLAGSSPDIDALVIHADSDRITAEFQGIQPAGVINSGKMRPMIVGVYTDLPTNTAAQALQGLRFDAEVDTRFSTTPSVAKYLAMFLGLLCLIVSLVSLGYLDRTDGRRQLRFIPKRWKTLTWADGSVLSVLAVWHFIGGNTSDDGYILTMARVAPDAGYMANYYRWFGVPESPFGSPYYDIIELFSKVSTASPWMRLPALICAVLTWFLLSREVIPRLGRGVRRSQVAIWTSAAVFLCFTMVFNNGLRPEPFVALMALATWCLIERAVATRRLLPAAIAVLAATIALSGNPTGLMAVAALLAGARGLLGTLVKRRKKLGILPQLAPLLASGTAVLICVFGDQTIATVREATRVRAALGPNLAWNVEFVRYYYLMIKTVDGGMPRRFAVLTMFLCLLISVTMMLRRHRIPGAAVGPSWRLIAMTFGTIFFMMFSPTKWTHHFGAYAGIAAALAALAAVAIGATALNSARNRTLFAAAILFLLALATAGINGWWYVSSYGVPWFDRPPQLRGELISTGLLMLAVAVFIFAGWQHFRQDYVSAKVPTTSTARSHLRTLAAAPLTIVAWLMVIFYLLVATKAGVSQYPAYSVAKGNLKVLTGQSCMLADDILVEPNPNDSLLSPAAGAEFEKAQGSLSGQGTTNVNPNGLPVDLSADPTYTPGGQAGTNSATQSSIIIAEGESAGTAGGRTKEAGVNGSHAKLPFGLDPKKVPVLGTFQDGVQQPSSITTTWFQLPERSESRPLVVVSAAGRVLSRDMTGNVNYGQPIFLEYGRRTGPTTFVPMGRLSPMDIGPAPSWRNLRFLSNDIPEEANVVRIVGFDGNLDPDQWLAITPPRVPELQTLNEVVGSNAPVLLDWAVGLQFPCQRPFGHKNGVIEIPQWRILPDRPLAVSSTDTWQAYDTGGPLGIVESTLNATTVPTYLRDDWGRDWGSLERYTVRTTKQTDANGRIMRPVTAELTTGTQRRSGFWTPGSIRLGV